MEASFTNCVALGLWVFHMQQHVDTRRRSQATTHAVLKKSLLSIAGTMLGTSSLCHIHVHQG